MRRLYPREYRICWLVGVLFFAVVFPYGCIGDAEIEPVYPFFCGLLNALSAVLYCTILFKTLCRRFSVEEFKVYAWFLVLTAFCHLVFTFMSRGSWVCIGVTAVILTAMGAVWLKDWMKNRKNEKRV